MQINQTQWKIIEELAKSNKTPTELAAALKIKPPSIHLQLKQLEQNSLIQTAGHKKGKTRPYCEYSLGTGFIYFAKALPNETEKKFMKITPLVKLHLQIWAIPQQEYHEHIELFWWQIQKHLQDIDAIIVYGSVANGQARDGSDIDILLLVNKNQKKYEEQYRAVMIKDKIIMTQVFETDDFANSLKKGSKFAEQSIKNCVIIYDPKEKASQMKKWS